MDNNYENIVPWNGANDTGRDVRLKLQRNFSKIGINFLMQILKEFSQQAMLVQIMRKKTLQKKMHFSHYIL